MLSTDTLIWLILGGTTVVCVLSMLGVFASVVRHQTDLHDLRNRVAELQYSYTLQLARLHGHIDAESDEGGVDIVDDSAPATPLGDLRSEGPSTPGPAAARAAA